MGQRFGFQFRQRQGTEALRTTKPTRRRAGLPQLVSMKEGPLSTVGLGLAVVKDLD
jgi:hypothetical protein